MGIADVTLTFLTKSLNNEFACLVQKAHPRRTFLRDNTRTNFIWSLDLFSELELYYRTVTTFLNVFYKQFE